MFGINYHKLIKKSFEFLKKLGFDYQEYQKGPDLEIVYSYQDVIIEISYYYGIDKNYNSGYFLDVIISKNGFRENLLKSTSVFGQEKILELSNALNSTNIKNKISLYAQFIMDNSSLLLE